MHPEFSNYDFGKFDSRIAGISKIVLIVVVVAPNIISNHISIARRKHVRTTATKRRRTGSWQRWKQSCGFSSRFYAVKECERKSSLLLRGENFRI
jgi:hypothetical protein